MLDNTDTLLALAEIAAAFAGFAALVSVFRRGTSFPGQALHTREPLPGTYATWSRSI